MSDDIIRIQDCYCGIWDKNPAYLETQGTPRGYRRLRQASRPPGKVRHLPGAAPRDGCGCDRHYRRLSIGGPLGSRGILIYGSLIAPGLWLPASWS